TVRVGVLHESLQPIPHKTQVDHGVVARIFRKIRATTPWSTWVLCGIGCSDSCKTPTRTV
ncbi:hypothetical protein D3OALGB2SA_4048, partial [Olavius algarvensis associated proteobacterium Delta 3]